MRKFMFIFGAILAYLLFCSKSCDSPNPEDTTSIEVELGKTKDSIKDEFESEDLSRKTLRAFETKAKEKLVDFSDYLNLYAGHSLDDTMKNQVRQAISELFISDSIIINMKALPEANVNNLKLNAFLTSDIFAIYDSVGFRIDSVEVVNHLSRKADFSYAGILKFTQSTDVFLSPDNSKIITAHKTVDFSAVKVNRTFGADTLQIWKVLLGNIE